MIRRHTPASTRRLTPRGGTALLVDDDGAVRRAVRRMLEHLGYDVIEAANGEVGLGMAAAHVGQIDLVVTDFMMPKMNGGEFVSKLATSRPQARIVFTSGYTDDAVLPHVSMGRAHVFLQKPFTAEQLGRAVSAVIDWKPPAAVDGEPG